MNWIRIKEKHFVNEDQIRDLQFIVKGDEHFYRVFFLNGANVDVKGFATEADAFEHANKTFNLVKEELPTKILEYDPEDPPKTVIKATKSKTKGK